MTSGGTSPIFFAIPNDITIPFDNWTVVKSSILQRYPRSLYRFRASESCRILVFVHGGETTKRRIRMPAMPFRSDFPLTVNRLDVMDMLRNLGITSPC